MIRLLDSAGSTLVEWGRQQHVLNHANMMKNTYAEWRNKLYQDKECQLNEI